MDARLRGVVFGGLGALALTLALVLAPAAGASFKKQRSFPVGEFALSLAVGDLNRDGRPDAVTANNASQDISVLLGTRKGVFKKERRIKMGDYWPVAVAVGRINRDRYPDVAVVRVRTDLSMSDVVVLKSRKRGRSGVRFKRLGPFLISNVPFTSPKDAEIADLNRDGKGDVVVADRTFNQVGVLLGRNNGSLRPLKPFAVGIEPYEVEIGRINDDKRLDVAVANLSGNSISILRGRAGAELLRPAQHFPANRPLDLALGDVGGDDRTDLLYSVNTFLEFGRMINSGAGFMPPETFAMPDDVSELAIGRINADRRPDIVALVRSNPPQVRVLTVGAGGAPKLKKKGWPMEIDAPNSDMVLADLSRPRDGKPDIITADGTRGTVSVLFHR
jgi:hypothetical protein